MDEPPYVGAYGEPLEEAGPAAVLEGPAALDEETSQVVTPTG